LLASCQLDGLPQSLTGQPFPQILTSTNVVIIGLKILSDIAGHGMSIIDAFPYARVRLTAY
jgi:hypothetical protein